MKAYRVVTDIEEIRRLNSILAGKLKEVFTIEKTRTCGTAGGGISCKVYFEGGDGGVLGWAAPKTNKDRYINLMLAGDPSTEDPLSIMAQLNFPLTIYNRRPSGVFIKDCDDRVFIAHRGSLTEGGRGALRKASVLNQFRVERKRSIIEADDGSKAMNELILIAGLDDTNIVDQLYRFANEAREVAREVRKASVQSGLQNAITTKSSYLPKGSEQEISSLKWRTLKLRKYFDEHTGVGRTKGHEEGERSVEHGAIVKALEAFLRKSGETFKAQAIDLAVINKSHVELYEIKTSAITTAVYTGIGQLQIHGECISESLDLPVDRYLVLPNLPHALYIPHVIGKCEIKIMLFVKENDTYRFKKYEPPICL